MRTLRVGSGRLCKCRELGELRRDVAAAVTPVAAVELALELGDHRIDVVVELFGLLDDRLLGEGVREIGGFFGGRGVGGHDDDVRLRDGLGGDAAEQRFGAQGRVELLLDALGDVDVRDQPGGGLDVTGRVGGLADEAAAWPTAPCLRRAPE